MTVFQSQTHKAKLYSDFFREDNLELLLWESARGDFVNVEYVFLAFADKQDPFWFWTVAQIKNRLARIWLILRFEGWSDTKTVQSSL